MNYFITTTSEQVLIRIKTGEYSSALVCSFTAANALAAIVCCEALNSNCLSQTKATQEMEQPGEQDWLALRDEEDADPQGLCEPDECDEQPCCDDCGSTLVGIPTNSGNTYWSGCTCS